MCLVLLLKPTRYKSPLTPFRRVVVLAELLYFSSRIPNAVLYQCINEYILFSQCSRLYTQMIMFAVISFVP